jgi:D-glycero-D-manno-heptose 1,7-bisphosphate phosphatase
VGLLEQIANYYHQDLTGVSFIGDSWKDIEAGLVVHCKPVLVKTGNGLYTIKTSLEKLKNIPIFENLHDFVETFLMDKLQVTSNK